MDSNRSSLFEPDSDYCILEPVREILRESKKREKTYCEEHKDKIEALDKYRREHPIEYSKTVHVVPFSKNDEVSVKAYVIENSVADVKVQRVPREWFAPIYYSYLFIKNLFNKKKRG